MSKDLDCSDGARLARIEERSNHLVETVNEIKLSLEKHQDKFVTQHEFKPVKAIAFGMVSVILTGFVVMVLAVVGSDSKAKNRENNRPEDQNTARISSDGVGLLPE